MNIQIKLIRVWTDVEGITNCFLILPLFSFCPFLLLTSHFNHSFLLPLLINPLLCPFLFSFYSHGIVLKKTSAFFFLFPAFTSSTTSLFLSFSVQHASWWTRGSSRWSHPLAVQPQVPCSLWQMQCTSPTFSSRETGMVLPAPHASSTPAQMERATRWLPVHLFESVMSYSRSSLNYTGRSSSSFMRATMVSWMTKCIL